MHYANGLAMLGFFVASQLRVNAGQHKLAFCVKTWAF
jgi:hypothetical protein